MSTSSAPPVWARTTFILAATGSAVGLGNIWKFPFITGEYGGAAFVLVYLACILAIGLPVFVAEVLIGRHTRKNPIGAIEQVARESGAPKAMNVIGLMGVLAGVLILSFYSMIAGWSLDYMLEMAKGTFDGISQADSEARFGNFIGDFDKVMLWHTVFMVISVSIIAAGVIKGLEKSLNIMMPMLVGILLLLVGYSMFSTGHFMEGVNYLFAFNPEAVTREALVKAMGHAFFTLSLGMGAIMTYGAYMPNENSITKTAFVVVCMDTAIALLAGMAIFPIVFAGGGEAAAGPGLMFIALPQAFGSMPGGAVWGTLFFLMVAFAALSSAISLVEPGVSWLTQKTGTSRKVVATGFGVVVWLLGILSVASFSHWSDVKFLAGTFFDNLDYLTSNIMLPLGGILVSIFVGWFVAKPILEEQLPELSPKAMSCWLFFVRVVAPVAIVLAVFVPLVMGFFE